MGNEELEQDRFESIGSGKIRVFGREIANAACEYVQWLAEKMCLPRAPLEYLETTKRLYCGDARRLILLDKFLEQRDMRMLTVPEFIFAHEQTGMVCSLKEPWRKIGLVISGRGNPNIVEAERLVSQAEQMGLELPVLASYSSLDMDKNLQINLGRRIELAVSGKRAEKYLERFDKAEQSGVCSLARSGSGELIAGHYSLYGASQRFIIDRVYVEN